MDNQELHVLLSKLSREELAKGMKEFLGLSGIRDIEDLWQDIHAVPTREQIKTGPAMVSSGAGADRAMKEYASPAPQIGITKQYEQFDADIAGWQEVRGSIKSLATEFKDGMAALVAAIKPVAKADEPTPDAPVAPAPEEPVQKATSEDWDKLAELQQAVAESQGTAGIDAADLMKALCLIEEAETHLDGTGVLEAHKAIAKGWAALAKAKRKVETVSGMSGEGNQEDSAVPSKAPLKVARAKARYWQEKVASLEGKSPTAKGKCSKCGASMKAKEEEEEKEEVEVNIEQGEDEEEDDKKAKKAAPPMKLDKAEKEDEKDSEKEKESGEMVEKAVDKTETFKKSVANRLAAIEKRLASPQTPAMTPLIISENGIKTEALSKSIMDKVSDALDNGELTEEGATQAKGLIDRYRAAAKGHIAVDIVNQQLSAASLEVQNFFDSFKEAAAQ